jgi:hypothetical protein
LSLDCHCIQLKSCVNLGLGAWFFVCPTFHPLEWPLTSLFIITHQIGLLSSYDSWFFSMHMWLVGIDSIRTHFLCCARGGECTATHDAVWDSFTTIAWDVGFHVLHEQIHVFLTPFF